MNERQRFTLAYEGRPSIARSLAAELARHSEITVVVLYGSFLSDKAFRDIDIALVVDEAQLPPERFLGYELDRLEELSRFSTFPLDIRIVNRAPVLFRYAVTQGQVLFCRNESRWNEFRERTWKEYLDFAPVAQRYIEELAHG
jgi:predicted nucleotidyltransferase